MTQPSKLMHWTQRDFREMSRERYSDEVLTPLRPTLDAALSFGGKKSVPIPYYDGYSLRAWLRGAIRERRVGFLFWCGGKSLLPLCVSRPAMHSDPGLSPRVRESLGHGSIPACAGEPGLPTGSIPACAPFRRGGSWVYPRVCGGTPATATLASALSGLSPRVRGNPGFVCQRLSEVGSIPACAGEPVP